MAPCRSTISSGEEIRERDRVLFHGEPGEVEFVADKLMGETEFDWSVKELGGGVMVVEPKCFGRAFLIETQEEEDLVFVSRCSEV